MAVQLTYMAIASSSHRSSHQRAEMWQPNHRCDTSCAQSIATKSSSGSAIRVSRFSLTSISPGIEIACASSRGTNPMSYLGYGQGTPSIRS
jgi:hypothetical protein